MKTKLDAIRERIQDFDPGPIYSTAEVETMLEILLALVSEIERIDKAAGAASFREGK